MDNAIDCSSNTAVRKNLILAALLLSLMATAQADEMYILDFTPTENVDGLEIDGFSLTFTVPTFVTTGQSPAFPTLSLNDGSNAADLTEDLVLNVSGVSCFDYQTPTNATTNDECGQTWEAPDGGVFEATFASALPDTAGTYTGYGIASFYSGIGGYNETEGTVQLKVTSVPEPTAPIVLLATLLLVAFVARKRIARGITPATRNGS